MKPSLYPTDPGQIVTEILDLPFTSRNSFFGAIVIYCDSH